MARTAARAARTSSTALAMICSARDAPGAAVQVERIRSRSDFG